jgi:SAM-dependent methyltransferase
MAGDVWAQWLAERRHGGSAEARRRVAEALRPIRDRVLDDARIGPGATVLDVGAGDGLIGFGALDLVGPAGRVVFSDISPALVATCREAARALGVEDRCDFLVAPATDLAAVPEAWVDAVTVRSVLIYVDDHPAAFREAARVLRPGGRLAVFEPVNALTVDLAAAAGELLLGVAAYRVPGLALPPCGATGDPLHPVDAARLAHLCEGAGLRPYTIAMTVVSGPAAPADWDTLLATSPNPLAPTYGEVFASLGEPACSDLHRALRPLVESGQGIERRAWVHLTAERPAI